MPDQLSELDVLILRLIAKHDGTWSWYQLDRAIGNGPTGFVGPFMNETDNLIASGLLMIRPNEKIPGMPYYCTTALGRDVVRSAKVPGGDLGTPGCDTMSDGDYAGFLSALGQEFAAAIGNEVDCDMCPQDGYEVWLRAMGSRPTPDLLRDLWPADIEKLRSECEAYLECTGVTTDQVLFAVSRTLARWPAKD